MPATVLESPYRSASARTRHRRRLLGVPVLASCLLLSAGSLEPAAPAIAGEADRSATLRASIDGFTYLDGSRDTLLTTNGWCPSGDPRLLGLACNYDGPSGGARLHTGLLGFDAHRRVSVPPTAAPAVSRRALLIEVAPSRRGRLDVTVDAAPAKGVTFTLVPETAVPPPDQADARQVTWTADSDGGGEHRFLLTYDTDLGSSGAEDAIPAVLVRLSHDPGGVAAEHLRGAIPAPAGSQVQRISELVYTARVVAPTGPPRLDAGAFSDPVIGPGRTGLALSNTHQLTALGDAPPGMFDDASVTAEHMGTGPWYHASQTWSWAGTDNVFADVGFDYGWDEEPWYRVSSLLGFRGDPAPGLLDGMASRATYFMNIDTHPDFYPEDDPRPPRNDDGRLVFDWDGLILDEVGFTDAYGALTREDELIGLPFAWLGSTWNVETRVTGGDIDRRGVQPDPSPEVAPPDPDATFRLEAPPGWQINTVFSHGEPPRMEDAGSSFNEDGSFTYALRVADGEYLLESELGPDGLPTWSWDLNFVAFADPIWEGAPPSGIEHATTLVVPPGEEMVVHVFARAGDWDRLVLGPGTHIVRPSPDGSTRSVRSLEADLPT